MKFFKIPLCFFVMALLAGTHARAEETILIQESLSWQTSAEKVGSGRFTDGGWQTTGGYLLFDAGKTIENGFFQVRMKGWTSPAQGTHKNHPLSGWENDRGFRNDAHQNPATAGAYWNWRIGEGYEPFKILAKRTAAGVREENRIFLPQIDGEPHVYRVQWNNGHVEFFFDGAKIQEWTFSQFSQRYFLLGRDDNWNYDPPDTPPIIYDLKIGEGRRSVTFEDGVLHDPLDGWSLGNQSGAGDFVAGGGWKSQGGWIEYDAGEEINNGYFEAEMRGWTAPPSGSEKNHPLSGWQNDNNYYWRNHTGAYWNWRIGSDNSPQAFAFLANSPGGTMQDVKSGEEAWIDAADTHLYRVVWNGGTVRYYFDDVLVEEMQFPEFKLRYFLIGKDDGYNYDPPDDAPIITNVRIVKIAELNPVEIITNQLPGGVYQQPYLTVVEAQQGLTPYQWSVTAGALPDGLTLNDATGQISGIPVLPGVYDFNLSVTDSNTPATGDTISLSIAITNDAPVFPESSVTLNLLDAEPWKYGLNASDANGNALTYTLLNTLDWLALDGDTLRGTTPPGNHEFALNVHVSDGLLADTLHLTLLITSDNGAPVITSPDTVQAIEDQLLTYIAAAADPEDDPLSFLFSQLPAWLTVQGDTVSGMPLEGAQDTSFVVQVSDPLQAVTQTVVVEVLPVNDPPVLVSEAGVQTSTGAAFQYTAAATDPEDSVLTFTFSGLADWMNADGAVITGTVPNQPDTVRFDVRVSDGDLEDVMTVTVQISQTLLPLQVVSARADTATEGLQYTYAAHVQNPNGSAVIYDYLEYPSWLTVQDSILSGSPGNGAQDTVFVWQARADGLSETITVALKVQHVNSVPRIVNLSSLSFVNTQQLIVNLDTCAIDDDHSAEQLTWQVIPALDAITSVVTNQTVIVIAPGWSGESSIEFIVTDPEGAADTLSVPVTVEPVSAVSDALLIPETFSLKQNFPNPFNPQTTIGFGLPEQSSVKIAVYNLNGQWIETIFEGVKKAGYHAVQWHAGSVPSGTYVIQMKAGEHIYHRKCLLVR